MKFERQVTINAPADKVWKIVGTDFNDVSEWSSFVLTSQGNPDLPPGSGRICNVQGMGEVLETLYEFDNDQRALGFTLESQRNPFFMRKIENTWRIEPAGENRAVVHIGVNITLLPVFSQLMGGRLSKIMHKRADRILAELKHFAENDTVLAAS